MVQFFRLSPERSLERLRAVTALYDTITGCSCDICLADFTPEDTTEIERYVSRAVKKIYTGSYEGEFPRELWELTVNKLNEAVDLEFGEAYKPLANQLKYQNSVFAAFKSKNQTQTLENLKAASKAKTFTDFAAEVDQTVKDYNYNHLKAEWNTAKKAARSAKRWAKAVEDSDLFPNIKYLPSTAKEPRDKHKAYYNKVFKMDDPLLDSILPPSEWGCECGWTTTDEELTVMDANPPKPDPGLDNNPGKDGALIATSHPHIKKQKKNTAAILKTNISKIYGIDERDITEFYHNSKTNGSYFSVEKLAKVEKKANKRIAKAYADKGHLVELYGHDSLDSMVDGRWNEFKSPTMSVNAFDQEFRKANRQFKIRELTGDLTFELPDEYSKGQIQNALKGRISRKGFIAQIENVHFVHKGKYLGFSTIEEVKTGKLPL